MKIINKHGRPMIGLRRASGETFDCARGLHVDVVYDRGNGEVWTDLHVGQSWTEYHDRAIVHITSTTAHMMMQEIADAIDQRLSQIEAWERYEEEREKFIERSDWMDD